ncbi:uncharacterized protein BXZ73DRAFT_58361 [Epithele typhae]|uniref:uncharacterized protein n=1 Tax=Epithele typhae TaxID=378194 RepID=UPI002007D86D|nr:uncharacterized protein BXZ73DRAFT_58361 [Epithele typhae]KAH9910495.1 hypothetical protein BXZ73DRAFT_58361 [Epithele typhae]
MPSSPRWVEAVNNALRQHPEHQPTVYQVATVDASGHPRVRTQVHRAFHHPPDRPDLPLLVTSTDAHTPKVTQLHASARVELCWWFPGTQDQFRIAGFAHVRPAPSPSAPAEPTPIPAGATALETLRDGGFDWDAKRREAFLAMSPGMRASWCAPDAPGSPLGSYEEQKGWPRSVPAEPETEEDRKNWEMSLGNFALMLVEPVEVDWVELGVKPNRRTAFKREGEGWVEQLVVP